MVGVGALVLTLPLVLSVLLARGRFDSGLDHARAGFGIGRAQSGDPAAELQQAADQLGGAHRIVAGPWNLGARLVPGVAQQQRALEFATATASDLASDGSGSVTASRSDELMLDHGRLDLAKVREASKALGTVEETLASVRQKVRDDRLHSPWLIGPTRQLVDDMDLDAAGARSGVHQALRTTEALPAMFGADGPRRYLVVLVDPSIARAQGGVAHAYAHVTVDDGEVTLEDSGPIEALDGGRSVELTGPSGYLNRYGAFDPAGHPGDVTYSPDLGDVATVLGQLDHTVTESKPLDGVIVMDPTALAKVMESTGTTGKASRSAAAQVRTDLSGQGSDDVVDRRYARGLRGSLERVLGSSTVGPAELAARLGPLVDAGHLAMHSRHEEDQAFLRGARAAREIEPATPAEDVFGVTSQNVRADGLDRYLQRRTVVTASYDVATGATRKQVLVTLRNTAKSGTSRQWVSAYTPQSLVGVVVDGEYVPVRGSQEAGVNAFSTYVDVPAGKVRTVGILLFGQMEPGNRYRVRVFDQPGAARSSTSFNVRTPIGYRATRAENATMKGRSRSTVVPDGGHVEITVHFRPRRPAG